MPGSHVELTYCANSRILNISYGNHRLLAFKILGISILLNIELDPKSITICNDQPNEPLNQALLYFEELYAAEDPTKTRWDTQNVINYESLLLELAATYQRSTVTDKSNELYLFTKHDLAKIAALLKKVNEPHYRGRESPDTSGYNIWLKMDLPKRLEDYVTIYTHLNNIPTRIPSFLQLFRRPAETTPLTSNQQEIKLRWEKWRAGKGKLS